jgi:aspartate/methionine/tyrosine aminotransferase
MDLDCQQDVVRFCVEHDLVLIADEVYQENVHAASKQFRSFRKVALELGLEDTLELASLHSVSKGFFGECGRRGGYLHLSPSWCEEAKATLVNLYIVMWLVEVGMICNRVMRCGDCLCF